jgi:tetratricopeptide (TPR) repeat protein
MRIELFRAVLVLAVALAMSAPALAQSTGMVKGRVVDAEGKPVEDAKILIEFAEGVTRKNETKTNRKGEFIQIGLFPGNYKVTASKDGVGAQSFGGIRVRIGQAAEVNFQLSPQSGMTEADKAKNAALQKVFDEGVAAARASQHDVAIAKFTEAATLLPNCHDCYYNIGFAQAQKQQYAEAEASFKKAIELKPTSAEAYNGLATIYNAQKKFDEAAAASAKAAELAGSGAAGGGSAGAEAVYNQGVILWNAGKYAEAKAQFEKAISLNPNMADAHYQLGMANLNLGQIPDAVKAFEGYLQVAPDGPKAAEVKGAIAALKK